MKLDELEASKPEVSCTALVLAEKSTFSIIENNAKYLYLMDPYSKQVERKVMGPDRHLGGLGGE